MGWYEAAKKKAMEFEGVIPHMYLDTKGYVTVGVGFLINTVSKATQYAFVKRGTATRASRAEIEADWKAVNKMAKGMVASRYKSSTKFDLPMNVINAKFDTIFRQHVTYAKEYLSSFDKQPDACKEALADMAYNLGGGGLKKYKKLKKAIEAGDWAEAAKQSHRNGPGIKRNKYVYNLFMSCARNSGGMASVGTGGTGSVAGVAGASATASLKASVGQNGVNHRDDVKLIQGLLNKFTSRAHFTPLKVDGLIGRRTVAAIHAFQRSILKFRNSDGRVDPGGKTIKGLQA